MNQILAIVLLLLPFTLRAVTIAWDFVPNATSYRLYVGSDVYLTDYFIDTTNTTVQVQNYAPGLTMFFWVTSLIGTNESEFSNAISYMVPLRPIVVSVDIEASQGLNLWTNIASLTITNQPLGTGQMFYRAVMKINH